MHNDLVKKTLDSRYYKWRCLTRSNSIHWRTKKENVCIDKIRKHDFQEAKGNRNNEENVWNFLTIYLQKTKWWMHLSNNCWKDYVPLLLSLNSIIFTINNQFLQIGGKKPIDENVVSMICKYFVYFILGYIESSYKPILNCDL